LKHIATAMLGSILAVAAPCSLAHHSFAIYDMSQNVEFEGVVETLRFRNPHMAMTLKVKVADGNERIVEFVEGAPANMLARIGLRPELIPPGTEITAIGAPRHDNPDAWFLKVVVLPDGTRFNSLQSPNQTR